MNWRRVRDNLPSVLFIAVLLFIAVHDVVVSYSHAPVAEPADAGCDEEPLSFMCCRTFVEEPGCRGGTLQCRPGFEACEYEDAGAD